MSRLQQLKTYKNHLEKRYLTLLEKSNDYKFVDEPKSDRAAFKALKILEKLNRVKYLDKDVLSASL